MVMDVVNDDNFIIVFFNNIMDIFQLFCGDIVLVCGKKRKDIVLIVFVDDDFDDGSVCINCVVCYNFRVKYGDMIIIYLCFDIKYVSLILFVV